ncbi:DUF5412 family protein [Aliarcobacter lanthieri]|uniref:DUF5412 family protein n=1 Tax=Aliarcobacter lanthieri TaxID=1355374 RepID=UPI000691058E|nr:DUF5412 family protein [Aliarcobacter lanthieri]QKF58982.1 hypothetical protein ALANTH_0867 [Aliarcobacter lanthieri]
MIKKIFKIIVIIFGFIIVAFFGIVYLVLNNIPDLCANSIFKEYFSPDKTKKVVIYERDCGATTTWSTHISILDYDKQLDNKDESILSIRGRPAEVAPNITWIDNKNIIIHHKINGKEIKTKNEFGWLNPIKIIYE